MKCQQCERPAFYECGDQRIPLCIECYSKLAEADSKLAEANFRKFLMNAAMINQSLDDMDFVTGLASGGGRIPVAAIAGAFRRGSVSNNFNVTNSQIGVINTGDLRSIDAAITLTAGTDAEAAGRQLKELTQAIIDAQDIAAETKKELVELIQALSVEIVQRSRKKSVIASLLGTIEERAKGLNAIVQLVSSLKGVIGQLFGGDLNV
jgi:hypothetical protein